MLRCSIIRCGRPRNCAGLVSGIGQRTRGARRSGPGIRDSHYITAISLCPLTHPALRWPNADETSLKHLSGAAGPMADPEDTTIFVGEIRAYFTFAGVCTRIRERTAIIAVQMYMCLCIHFCINVSVYVYVCVFKYIWVWVCMYICGTCPERLRECELARRSRIVPLRHTALSGYVWKRMNKKKRKGEMNLLGSQAIGRRPDRRINSF